tara:strand:+ start:62 stop:709 length:648 start_codon:yes stop_codon:yes gene_type:complete
MSKWSSFKESQLITESWRKFLTEGDQVLQAEGEIEALVERYRGMLHEGKISEAQLQEGIKDELQQLLNRYGKKAMMLALAGTIGLGALTGGPAASYAADAPTEEPIATQQATAEASSMDVEEAAGLLGWVQLFQNNRAERAGSGREGISARADLAQELAPLQKALRQVVDGDPSALMQLDGHSHELLQIFQKSFDKIPAAEKAEAAEMGHSIQVR